MSIYWLISARFLQGIGFAATLGLALVIIVAAFPEKQKGLASGAVITITGVSQAIGPTVGGIILNYLSWHWIFLINLPLGTIAIIGTLVFTPKDNQDTRHVKIDSVGLAYLMVAMALLVYTINQMITLVLWQIVSLLILGGILLASFFVRCLYHKHPLIPKNLLQHRNYLLITLSRVNFMFYMMTMLFIIPIYLIDIAGVSTFHTGLLMLMMTALAGIASPICGVLIDKVGYRGLIQLSFVSAIIGIICLCFIGSNLNFWPLIPGLMFYGIAVGLHVASSINGILVSSERPHHGVATGLFFTLGMLGGAVGVSLSGTIINFSSKLRLLAMFNHVSNLQVTPLLLNIAKGSIAGHDVHAAGVAFAQQSFIFALHQVMYVLFALSLIAFLLTLNIKNNIKKT